MEANNIPPQPPPANEAGTTNETPAPPQPGPNPPGLQEPTGDQTVKDMLSQLIAEQQAYRAETAQLRAEVNARIPVSPDTTPTAIPTDEEKLVARMAVVAEHPYYCPGCGRVSNFPKECEGSKTASHPPIEVVSTDELKSGDPARHTKAPASV